MRRLWQFVQTVLGLIFRHPVTGTAVIPVLPDGRIVLIRRRDNGRWALPGGMVDWGEDIPTTVRRELAEETGLDLVKIRRLVGVYSAADRDPRLHSICIVVEAEVQGKMQVQDSLEISEVEAFLPTALPEDQLSHDNGEHLQNYFQGLTTLA
ncbi:MAG: NUDIX hydrolase [Microcoleus sp. PH2017_29_MFU_D_A]|jgi:ADP-ribose pyrophosphatase YjhB (NUDIX family)|uniref:NUDIX hydrolase n=1 Tax=unclassified Microcoleus TaxID=2642155 RepID=UPI001E0CDEFA|nr:MULTISPECIES: NUDIX hydrolase [unclassified Microcoleus]MCC3418664.1 NUDIX hydrolase [Microcoleus sp. PH2017_07_MST_O_A]MCC3430241.1 NUDIX hydrolase [Microcoleus sp. PH2017_04_SCI_O_A]MCC3440983.1 NUDIX hydrolase [Microcoleus sp. PH2017_03_ELD_O_A]MCC3467470.1 NUDIX hydrolase [Microcoleus sp. PH2017_06_SFM_O_A]MCC3507436.1 NUDIX hydrolase [Microcoleus sp. PH2017_19_SFW_U_A]MCC3508219.1 NUDIX hydrolase [Microcoleus sp. PH2017_17_BER_D_A]TAE10321.1 MAG: NUDIX hydrolase [Oscillatoriales cyan